MNNRKQGFTLVELLVVIAIIGVLVALLLPAVQAAREAARRSQCTNNLKQIGLALLNYETAFKEFPSGRTGCERTTSDPSCANASLDGTSGFVPILPYLELQNVYDMFDFSAFVWQGGNGSWRSVGRNEEAVSQRPTVYVCPSDQAEPIRVSTGGVTEGLESGVASYALCMGSKGPSFQ